MKSPTVALDELIARVRRPVDVEDSVEYGEVGVYCFGRGLFHKHPRSGIDVGNKPLFEIRDGDFILQTTFAWEGAVAVAGPSDNGMFGSVRVLTFEPDRARCNPKYLQLYLSTPHGREQLLRISPGSAGRNRVLNVKRLPEVRVPLPPLADQDRLVAKTEAIRRHVTEARRLRGEIQTDGQALLHSVFHRLIQGAEYRPLGEVAPIVRRPVQVELDGAYPELGVRSFGKGTFHKPHLPGSDVGSKKLYHIHPGDLVFSNVFAWEGAIAVARPEDAGRVGSHRFITCVTNPVTANPDFLCFYLLTPEGMEQVREASPGGAGRNRTLGLAKLEQIRVPVPPIDRQQEFSALQAKVAAIREAQAANQAELDALLPAVLDRAFKGEL